MGFFLPPLIVGNDPDLDVVGRNLSYMYYGTAAVTTALFLLVVASKYPLVEMLKVKVKSKSNQLTAKS